MLWPTLLLLLVGLSSSDKAAERPIIILNESGSKFEIYWINPDTEELVLMSDPYVINGASHDLNSFVDHEFQLRELPNKYGVCKGKDQVCRTTYLTVTESTDQLATVNEDFELDFQDDDIRAEEMAESLLSGCQDEANERMAMINDGDIETSMTIMNDLVECIQSGIVQNIIKTNEELAFEGKIRKDMAEFMENYTCSDTSLNSSEPVEETTWDSPKDGRQRNVQIMLDRPASKIHVIEDFIDEEECKAMEEVAEDGLYPASVADGKGGSELSEHRKAMQARIRVPWEEEATENVIARLSRRVYDYTEHVLHLGIQEFGQEGLMSIQYSGRGMNDTEPDRYRPHCDGDCEGLPFKSGNRMATMVLYCTIPTVGGHTNFRNAGVHVKPRKGNAVFFSYIDPEKLVMDNGLTEHSGCPVYEGEKKIVTQWIRLGVDKENPYDSFNTLGVKEDETDD